MSDRGTIVARRLARRYSIDLVSGVSHAVATCRVSPRAPAVRIKLPQLAETPACHGGNSPAPTFQSGRQVKAKSARHRGQAAENVPPRRQDRATQTGREIGRSEALQPPRARARHDILGAWTTAIPTCVCALHHNSAWELLVATILSAQCTDVRVNMVTPGLFKKYPTPEAFAALKPEDLEPDIRSTGFFRNKSKSVVGAAQRSSALRRRSPAHHGRIAAPARRRPQDRQRRAGLLVQNRRRRGGGHPRASHLAPARADQERRPAQDRAGPDEGDPARQVDRRSRTSSSITAAPSASRASPSAPTVRWKTSATPPTRPGARSKSTSRPNRKIADSVFAVKGHGFSRAATRPARSGFSR